MGKIALYVAQNSPISFLRLSDVADSTVNRPLST